MMKTLTLESLNEFEGGKVSEAFKKLMARAVHDCLDRPGAKDARTIGLQFYVTPVIGQDGDCEGANVQVQITGKIPKYQTRLVDCSVRKNGALLFNDMSGDDVNQMSLDEENPSFRGDE